MREGGVARGWRSAAQSSRWRRRPRRPRRPRSRPATATGTLCDRTLDRVVLPATHNSMSNAAGGWQIPNQQVGIPAQLSAGVRGFLIDIYYAHRGADGKLVTDTDAAAGRPPLPLPRGLLAGGATASIEQLRGVRASCATTRATCSSSSTRTTRGRRTSPRGAAQRPAQARLRGASSARLADAAQADQAAAPGRDAEPGRHRAVPLVPQRLPGAAPGDPLQLATPDLLTDPAKWPASCQPNRGGTTGGLFLLNHWSPPVAPSPATSASSTRPTRWSAGPRSAASCAGAGRRWSLSTCSRAAACSRPSAG